MIPRTGLRPSPASTSPGRLRRLFPAAVAAAAAALTGLAAVTAAAADGPSRALAREYPRTIQPLLRTYCLDCHSTAKQKGDLDLERFGSAAEVLRDAKVWEGVIEQMGLGEMPPKDKPQPTTAERQQLVAWIGQALDEAARARAGDPGPVVLRRLNNAEYTFTIRDLTGVPTLDPAREFPADSAAGEGFMNVGQALVMSPALVTKYLDAAKDVASHAVLLPDGLGWSPSTSQRDWAEERLAAIRAFYRRSTVTGGGSAVNLQGIQFDTKDGGVLPLARYLEATLTHRQALQSRRQTVSSVAAAAGLNAKYLGALWAALHGTDPSLLLDPLRAQWRAATPADAPALAQDIARWQQALWRFTQVGHIGKRDGPKAWQVPVTPLAASREVRFKLPPPAAPGQDVTFHLAVSDAGDGAQGDVAVWENPRLVAPGRPDLPLRDVQTAVARLAVHRERILGAAAACLAAAAEVVGQTNPPPATELAGRHGVDAVALAAWLECLGLGSGPAPIEGHMTAKLESAQNHDFVKGWTGADALSVLANASGQPVRIPGNLKPHSVAVHPAPKRRVIVTWRSPVAATVRAEGVIQHAHPECGNGVAWAIELRRGSSRQRLAAGLAQGAKEHKFGPLENLSLQAGDALSVVISPRDGNHSCDLTAVDFQVSDGPRTWNLAKDVSSDLLAGNPHADRLGHPAVWHFHSEPDRAGGAETMVPAGSLLARWQAAGQTEERTRLAAELQRLLTAGPGDLPKDAPDRALHRQLTSLNGPLLSAVLRQRPETAAPDAAALAAARAHGLDPALFGRAPGGVTLAAANLGLQAPSTLAVRLPAELAEGCEFVATAMLHAEAGREGSVQMQVMANPPAGSRLTPGTARPQGSKGTWSDGELRMVSDAPILVRDGSQARQRIERDLDQFRQLFPAALCYTKIVPVDEVVTLTLYYREDHHLRRLMLDEKETAELERLWAELHYVSHDALKLVDAYEQLWQYATQDADPSAFEPLRKPIQQRAEAFRRLLADTEPAHLEAVLRFAEGAYRRPLSAAEADELRALYRRLRQEELAHDPAIRLTLARILVAPAFLYRAEKPGAGDRPGPVTDWELASRLSYFLWSSAPDAELRQVAAAGELRKPSVLAAQARRMLKDPRARRLATEFACAWLHVHGFDELGEKSERHFPTFNGLRGAMYEETIRFFTDLFQNDRPVTDILEADATFLNADLARHYGIPEALFQAGTPVADDGWRRVTGLKAHGRGGVLAQGTTLAKQSGASRTSPILRGNWLCEVLLGEKLPRPPKGVPPLPEDEATEPLTMRQLTEKHSSDPRCYGCHRRIDPYGYALEGYDAIGRRRTQDLGGKPVDVRTKVMDGSEIDGLEGLRRYLLTTRREAFLRQFNRKLLGYALGRGVLLSDNPLLDEMRAQLRKRDGRVGAVVEAIVRSPQFREIRGQAMVLDE
ncbi:MAG: hypothetical protein RJA22_19 [Verrucomicrobiota bacterium]|jgi:hypothetical protein